MGQEISDSLIEKAVLGDRESITHLIEQYLFIIRGKVFCFSPMGIDSDDLLQEGLLGLLDAINKYDSSRGASFKTFANTCIDNKISSALRRSSNKSNAIFNKYQQISEEMPSNDSAIFDHFEVKEQLLSLYSNMDSILSDFEKEVMIMIMAGYSYKSIAAATGKDVKSIDNCVQRMRKKLKIKGLDL